MKTTIQFIPRSLFNRLGDVFLCVLSPRTQPVPACFSHVCSDPELHDDFLSEIQAFRGQIYHADGAIGLNALDKQGRLRSEMDDKSWHLAIFTKELEVCGCIRLTRYVENPVLTHLKCHEMLERMPAAAAVPYRSAMEDLLVKTRTAEGAVAECGGWATNKKVGKSTKGISLACASWALMQLLAQPFLAFATATARNGSTDMLQKLGGFRLTQQGEDLPSFFDPHYNCDMDLLAFDEHPAPEFQATVTEIREFLKKAFVLSPHQSAAASTPPSGADEEEATTQLFECYAGRLLDLTHRQLDRLAGPKLAPTSVMQSVFTGFLGRHRDGNWDKADSTGLWNLLAQITIRQSGRRAVHDHTPSHDARSRQDHEESAYFHEAINREPTPDEAAVLAETIEVLLGEVEGYHRDIVQMSLQGATCAEIAAQTGVTERSVQRVLKRVRARIEQMAKG